LAPPVKDTSDSAPSTLALTSKKRSRASRVRSRNPAACGFADHTVTLSAMRRALILTLLLIGVSATPSTTQSTKILEFQGDNRFLSNFFPAEVIYEGITYPTAEHAYQAAKTLDPEQR